MIIGKSLTALGGGGLKPEIIVTAKAGALLNLHYKDSSIIPQSYQLGAEETQHTFVVDVSNIAYVVEDAINGKSVEVLVDVVAQYSVDIPYTLYLYKDGDPCTDVTGGYVESSQIAWPNSSNKPQLLDTHIYINPNNSNWSPPYYSGLCTDIPFNVTPYTTLKAIVDGYAESNSSYMIGNQCGISLISSTNEPGFEGQIFFGSDFGYGEYSADISELTGEKYLVSYAIRKATLSVYRVWLE